MILVIFRKAKYSGTGHEVTYTARSVHVQYVGYEVFFIFLLLGRLTLHRLHLIPGAHTRIQWSAKVCVPRVACKSKNRIIYLHCMTFPNKIARDEKYGLLIKTAGCTDGRVRVFEMHYIYITSLCCFWLILLTWHAFVTTRLVPLPPHIHQLIAQGVLWPGWVTLGVELGEGFRVKFRMGREVRVDVWGWLWGSVDRGQHWGATMAVHAWAALPRHFNQPRGGADRWRQEHFCGAEGHTAHCAVNARALVLTASTEVLAILIDTAVILTRAAFQFGCKRTQETRMSGSNFQKKATLKFCQDEFGVSRSSALRLT